MRMKSKKQLTLALTLALGGECAGVGGTYPG